MKTTLTLLLGLILPAIAAPPPVGSTPNDVLFAECSDFSARQYNTLTDSMLSSRGGKVLLIAYATPW